MKGVLCSIFLLVIQAEISSADLTIGSCDKSWFLIEKAYCDTEFVKMMNSSSNALDDCPDLYGKAHKCFEKKVYDECFEGDDNSEKYNKTVEFLEAEFGDEDFFCKYGLLATMESVMANINTTTCADQNFVEYEKCEEPFRTSFNDEFSNAPVNFTELSERFSEAKFCQSKVATSCNIPNNEQTYHFYDALEFNPYDPEAIKKIEDVEQKGEDGSNATVITVVIVGLILLVIVAGIFAYLWHRDKSRAEIRRQKREAKSNGGQEQNTGDTEMQPLSGAAVVQTSDEVSSA